MESKKGQHWPKMAKNMSNFIYFLTKKLLGEGGPMGFGKSPDFSGFFPGPLGHNGILSRHIPTIDNDDDKVGLGENFRRIEIS